MDVSDVPIADSETFMQVHFATEDFMKAVATPLTPERAFRAFKEEIGLSFFPLCPFEKYPGYFEKYPEEKSRVAELQREPERGLQQTERASKAAALEALQKMGMAPSDAEIQAVAEKHEANPEDKPK